MTSTTKDSAAASWITTVVGMVASAAVGAAVTYAWTTTTTTTTTTRSQQQQQQPTTTTTTTTLSSPASPDPETDYSVAHGLVWGAIGGALSAAQIYVGERLDLYKALREACAESNTAFVTAISLAQQTGYNQRWLREWLAQQAALGILTLLPSDSTSDSDDALHYRLPRATAEVLANPESPEYDICMIKVVPALVQRAKTMLPDAFRTGLGRPYDEAEVSQAIDQSHWVHIRDVVMPEVIPAAQNGAVLKRLQEGCRVADLGCGGGNLAIAMAQAFPKSTFHGFEVSAEALSLMAENVARSKLRNVVVHDANEEPLGSFEDYFDLVTTFDVLHDAPNPAELIAQVKKSLKPQTGVWLLADIPCLPTVRDSITQRGAMAATYFAFSTCLCMSCSLSTKDGAGLGTLGFTVPVAQRMLVEEGGFDKAEVLMERTISRWFVVT